ncbi:MAG: YggS family pyridoxal phosphate-dependent enzyme [Nocardioides sp.]|nr:YggS family pyridoxal phosphate-dependent enzyme [Nocardioides sp.]
MTGERADQLASNLRTVRTRIAAACAAAGRAEDAVALTVVTKFFPASDVALLAGLGVRAVGENKHQEGQEKRPEVVALRGCDDLTWHFVGGLQSNKAAAVAGWADVVESVDRVKLVRGLSRGAVERPKPLVVLVQVSLDPPDAAAGRAGALAEEVPALAEAVAQAPGLVLGGVMGVAPLGGEPAEAFARLHQAAERLQADHPGADRISAGMSGDLEQAVAAGATHVRVGSAVLGPRPVVQ